MSTQILKVESIMDEILNDENIDYRNILVDILGASNMKVIFILFRSYLYWVDKDVYKDLENGNIGFPVTYNWFKESINLTYIEVKEEVYKLMSIGIVDRWLEPSINDKTKNTTYYSIDVNKVVNFFELIKETYNSEKEELDLDKNELHSIKSKIELLYKEEKKISTRLDDSYRNIRAKVKVKLMSTT